MNGEPAPVRMVETVPFWLGQASRPKGWPVGSLGAKERWVTWPAGADSRLKLQEFESEELPAPSTLRVYRGTVRSLSKKPLRRVVAAAIFRESLNAPEKTMTLELGDLAPQEARPFELRPGGHQVDIVFGERVDDDLRPLPTLRQVQSMTRVLPGRPIREDRTGACLESQGMPALPADGAGSPSEAGAASAVTGDYIRPPKAQRMTRPEYGKQAFDAGVEGTVLLEILVGTTGYVDCARVVRSMPGTGLDAEAVKAVYEWRFEPAIKNGRPVSTLAQAPFGFRIF